MTAVHRFRALCSGQRKIDSAPGTGTCRDNAGVTESIVAYDTKFPAADSSPRRDDDRKHVSYYCTRAACVVQHTHRKPRSCHSPAPYRESVPGCGWRSPLQAARDRDDLLAVLWPVVSPSLAEATRIPGRFPLPLTVFSWYTMGRRQTDELSQQARKRGDICQAAVAAATPDDRFCTRTRTLLCCFSSALQLFPVERNALAQTDASLC